MRVALVHDFLLRLGGAERVLAAMRELFPQAPVYTLLYNEEKVGKVFPREKIIASGLQKFPKLIRKNHRYLLPFMPRAVEQWDFSKFDVVISSNSAFAHGILTPTSTRHICYFHSPMRFAWDWTHEYAAEQKAGTLKKAAIAHMLKKIRVWDQAASDRPDSVIANSHHVARRIEKYYRRQAQIIYPPVDISRFPPPKNSEHEDFFLIVSQLTDYKRVDLAVHLFNKIRRKLVIIGEGPARAHLENISNDNIEFLGFQPDTVVSQMLRSCRALIFPGEEDFGIVPVEAMACGKPVLAFGRGGVRESVIEGVTGEFFREATVASMEDGLGRLMRNEKNYSPSKIRKHAEKFSKEIFMENIKKYVGTAL